MANVIDCLLKKASDGLVSKKTAQKIATLIDEYKSQMAGGDDVGKELIAAQRAFDVIENRLAQKVKQQEIHLDLVTQGLERFKSKAPIATVLQSFSYPDEASAYRYGYLGQNASENVLSNQRLFKGMAVEVLDGLNPLKMAKKDREPFRKAIMDDLYAASRGVGNRSGDAEVRKIVDGMMELTTRGGQAFERAGGNITLRKDYFLGRNINTDKIIKAGKENFVRDSVKAYDLERVREATGGIIRTLDDLKTAAEKDFDAIVSGGISDLAEYAPPGMKSVVNSRNHHRIFSFKDADSDMLWHKNYGNEDLYRRVVDYANAIGKDIGVLQTYGPKPEAFLRAMLREAASIDPAKAAKLKDVTYRHFRGVTGQWDKSLDPTIAKWMTNYRATQNFSLLGTTNVDALTTDMALGATARKLRGMPALRGYARTMKRIGTAGIKADEKEWARLGWYTDGFIDDSLGLIVSAESDGASYALDYAARKNMQLSGLTRTTNATKGEGVRMLAELLTDDKYINSHKSFKQWLEINGIDSTMLNLVRNHGTEKVKGWNVNVASPLKLYESGFEKEAAKLGTIFNSMSEMVSPTTSARLRGYWAERERGSKIAQLAVGSMKGFTGYTGAFWERHLKPALYQPGALNKAKWMSVMSTPLIMAGVLRTMIGDALIGKDPKLDSSTVLRGLARSNILLMLGDPLLSGPQNDKTLFDRSLGVLAGHAGLGVGAIKDAAYGEWAKAGKRSQEFLERFVPGRNLWYTNLIQSRLVWDQLNRVYDEDAQKKFKQRAKSSTSKGAPYWWAPGELSPDRGPNLSNIMDQPFIRPENRKKK
jgi:hypothetical protein